MSQPRSRRGRWIIGLALMGAFAALTSLPAGSVAASSGTFVDDDGNVHESNIEAIAAAGITKGCNPPANTMFCPRDPVTRAQMAALLVRGLGYQDAGGGDLFVDDDDSIFEQQIDIIGTADITKGCNPPANSMFCPNQPVTREQMAAFLVRAFSYDDVGEGDLFVDDDDSIFEQQIDIIGTAGTTKGCNPPENTMFCPEDAVRRDQMASFLARALDLDDADPPGDSTTTTTAGTTTTTSPPPAADPVIIGAGDIASDDPADADTAEIILGFPEATVFTTGDNAYPDGTTEEFAEYYEPTWGAFKDRTYPSVGNHDAHVEGAADYFDYFGSNAGTPGEGWYSYDLAKWHVIVLNSECGDAGFASCDEQVAWLETDLATNGQACMLAYWHKPLFNSGKHEPGDDSMQDEWEILDEAGVDFVINGHDHNYQRYAPQDSAGSASSTGMLEFVAGTGGKDLYDQETTLANLEEFYVGHGVLKFDLGTASYSWEFIPTSGDYEDAGSGSCDAP